MERVLREEERGGGAGGGPGGGRGRGGRTNGVGAGSALGGDEAAVGKLLQLVARPRQVPHEMPVEARLLQPALPPRPSPPAPPLPSLPHLGSHNPYTVPSTPSQLLLPAHLLLHGVDCRVTGGWGPRRKRALLQPPFGAQHGGGGRRTFSVLSVLRSSARRLSGKKKCSRLRPAILALPQALWNAARAARPGGGGEEQHAVSLSSAPRAMLPRKRFFENSSPLGRCRSSTSLYPALMTQRQSSLRQGSGGGVVRGSSEHVRRLLQLSWPAVKDVLAVAKAMSSRGTTGTRCGIAERQAGTGAGGVVCVYVCVRTLMGGAAGMEHRCDASDPQFVSKKAKPSSQTIMEYRNGVVKRARGPGGGGGGTRS